MGVFQVVVHDWLFSADDAPGDAVLGSQAEAGGKALAEVESSAQIKLVGLLVHQEQVSLIGASHGHTCFDNAVEHPLYVGAIQGSEFLDTIFEFALEASPFLLLLLFAEEALNDGEHLFNAKWFAEVIFGAQPKGGDDVLLRPIGGHEDDGDVSLLFAQGSQDLQPRHLWHFKVQDHQVRSFGQGHP